VVATPRTRTRVLLQQALAIATAIVLACGLTGLFTLAAAPAAGESLFSVPDVVAACASLALAAGMFGALGFLFGQFFARRRSAAQPRDLLGTFRLGASQEARPMARAPMRLSGLDRLFLHNGLGRSLQDSFGTTIAWAAGLSLLAVLMTAIAPNVRHALLEQSQ